MIFILKFLKFENICFYLNPINFPILNASCIFKTKKCLLNLQLSKQIILNITKIYINTS